VEKKTTDEKEKTHKNHPRVRKTKKKLKKIHTD